MRMRNVAFAVLALSVAGVLVAGVAARWRYDGDRSGSSRVLLRATGVVLVGIAASVLWLSLVER